MSSLQTVSRQNSQETVLLRSVFVEVGNFDLHAYNAREKETHLKRLFGIFEILDYLSFMSTSRKVSAVELSVWY